MPTSPHGQWGATMVQRSQLRPQRLHGHATPARPFSCHQLLFASTCTCLLLLPPCCRFVVDKARGLILTNRHVVTPGACRPQLRQEEATPGSCSGEPHAPGPNVNRAWRCMRQSPGASACLSRPQACPPAAPAGPVVAEAIFLNREEVPVQPLYYDPGGGGARAA